MNQAIDGLESFCVLIPFQEPLETQVARDIELVPEQSASRDDSRLKNPLLKKLEGLRASVSDD